MLCVGDDKCMEVEVFNTRDSSGIVVSHVFSYLVKKFRKKLFQYINRLCTMNTSNEYDFLLSKLDHICEEISLVLTILTDDKDEPLVLVPRRSFIRHLR